MTSYFYILICVLMFPFYSRYQQLFPNISLLSIFLFVYYCWGLINYISVFKKQLLPFVFSQLSICFLFYEYYSFFKRKGHAISFLLYLSLICSSRFFELYAYITDFYLFSLSSSKCI